MAGQQLSRRHGDLRDSLSPQCTAQRPQTETVGSDELRLSLPPRRFVTYVSTLDTSLVGYETRVLWFRAPRPLAAHQDGFLSSTFFGLSEASATSDIIILLALTPGRGGARKRSMPPRGPGKDVEDGEKKRVGGELPLILREMLLTNSIPSSLPRERLLENPTHTTTAQSPYLVRRTSEQIHWHRVRMKTMLTRGACHRDACLCHPTVVLLCFSFPLVRLPPEFRW
jgi:hypothetical protein